MLKVGLILILFLVFVYLLMRNIVSMTLAYPLLAIGISVVVGLPFFGDGGIMKTVIEAGAVKMSSHLVAIIFAAWLGAIMNSTGISKRIIKLAAELGGDRPFLVTVLVIVALAACYTTLSGLGSVIMIATIAIPILINVGVPALTAISIFNFTYAIGLQVNLTNWAYFHSLTGVGLDDIKTFALIMTGVTSAFTLAFTVYKFKKDGLKFSWAAEYSDDLIERDAKVPTIALLTPLVPLFVTIAFDFTIVTAFMTGILYCMITMVLFSKEYSLKRMVDLVQKGAKDGISEIAHVISYSIVTGMLIVVVTSPEVAEVMSGAVSAILPTTRIAYILFFALLVPLTLFRGPMNIWGLGAGVAGLMISVNVLPPQAIMCAYSSCERTQVISDPTNTYSIWLADYVGTDVITLLKNVFLWSWALSAVGIVLSAFMWL